VLADVHALRERFCRIAVPDYEPVLNHGRACVEVRGDEVHRGSVSVFAGLEHAAVRVEPGIRWQQRRMNVQDAAGERVDESRAEYSHEAGKHDDVCAVRRNFRG
jgi:hypothetical protein